MDGMTNSDPETQTALSLLGAHVDEKLAEENSGCETPAETDASAVTAQPTLFDEATPPTTTKAVAKSKKKTDGTIIPPDPISQASHQIENLTASAARKMAAELVEAGEFELFRLGGVFSVVNNSKFFLEYGFQDFKAWVEAEHGIKYRKAHYLAAIYEYVIEFKLDWAKIQKLGWTKLKTLLNPATQLVTQANMDEWIEKAENMTVLQLEDYIKAKTSDGQNAIETDAGKTVTTLTFKLHTDQKETIREALEKAKEMSGTQVDTVALQLIATEFLGKPSAHQAPPASQTSVIDYPVAFKAMGIMSVLEILDKAFPDVKIAVEMPEGMIDGQETPDEL
jgi:hypothetical protein